MREDDLVVTGCGIATALGCTTQDIMTCLKEGNTHFRAHPQLNSQRVAYLNDDTLYNGINLRIARKLDRFCMLAMQAFNQTLQSSNISESAISDFGIIVGNSTGGWSFVEPQMDDLYNGNYELLSPYVATAWFPTAPQGEISIQYKISGYSKTIAADALSFGYALDHARDLCARGVLPGAFVGGVEAPLSPLVYNACMRTEPLSPTGTYLPFHDKSDGYVLGEGAGFSLQEPFGLVQERKGNVLAYIKGLAIAPTLCDAIKDCLADASVPAAEVDCIFLDAKGTSEYDKEELAALKAVFGQCRDVYMTTTKTLYGSLLAADFAVQVSMGVLALQAQTIPRGLWSKSDHTLPSFGRVVLDKPIETLIKNVLVYARNQDGASACVLLSQVQ